MGTSYIAINELVGREKRRERTIKALEQVKTEDPNAMFTIDTVIAFLRSIEKEEMD